MGYTMTSRTAHIYRPLPNGEELEIEVTVEGSYIPYTPAKINGPPEDCYPAEGGYAEDICAYITLPSRAGKKAKREEIPLTADEIEEFGELFADDGPEYERDAYDEWHDRRMECFDD